MIEFVTFNFEEVVEELKNRAREEGIAGKEAYDSFIDDLINEKFVNGELDKDNDIETVKHDLSMTWKDYSSEL